MPGCRRYTPGNRRKCKSLRHNTAHYNSAIPLSKACHLGLKLALQPASVVADGGVLPFPETYLDVVVCICTFGSGTIF
uniref:Uncharacterized protein n=1 Tax=Anguilla anguilla TaxID=7936 RepID=A0A0E9QK13_ANGAN